MGILGLQSYMERHYLTERINLKHMAQQFRETHGTTPILLIDGSCWSHIYNKACSDRLCGGQNKEFIYICQKFLSSLEKCGIKCVVFAYTYPPEDRIEIWRSRRVADMDKARTIMSAIESNAYDSNTEEFLKPIGRKFAVTNFLRCTNIEVIQCIHEADGEIIDYVNKKKCLGVMGHDSEFIIAEGVLNFFSVKDLDIHTMETIAYRRDYLARKLNLRIEFLPMFATVTGNDVVRPAELRKFHLRLLARERNYETLAKMEFLPKNLLFPRIAQWINDHAWGENITSNPGSIAEMIGSPELHEKFARSVASYYPSNETFDVPKRSGNSLWDRIVDTTVLKVRHENMYFRILCVVLEQSCFTSVSQQHYSNPAYLTDVKVCRNIKRKFFGLLLKEHPQWASLQVKDYSSHEMHEVWPKLETPVYPDNHPGLLSLWSDNYDLEEKWRLLGWIVNESVPLSKLRALPEQLQIPTLSLYYMTHDFKDMLKPWVTAAFAFVAVRLLKITPRELHDLQCFPEDSDAIHYSSVYQSVCMWISYAADACGNPTCLFKFKDYSMFDGKLFHLIYLSLKYSGIYCFRLDDSETQLHDQMLAVINS